MNEPIYLLNVNLFHKNVHIVYSPAICHYILRLKDK